MAGTSYHTVALAIAAGALFLAATHRVARYYEADIPPTSLMHGLWVQSTEWCARPFPEECGICRVVAVIQTAIMKIVGDIIGGFAFLIFLVERVWHMIFGPSESDLLELALAKQQAGLKKLESVRALSAQLLEALKLAVKQSNQLATAVQDVLSVKLDEEIVQTEQAKVEDELTMIDQVLEAVMAQAEKIASDPERGKKMEQFKTMLQQKAREISTGIVLIDNIGNEMEEVVCDRETVTDNLEAAREKIDRSLKWMVGSLVDILIPTKN